MQPLPDIPRSATAGLDLFDYATQAGCSVSAPPMQNPCTPPADPPPELAAIAAVLTRCVRRPCAMTAPAIAEAAGLWPQLQRAERGTRARQIIRTWYEHLARPGYVLVASSIGFFYTDDPEDMSAFDATTRSRACETFGTLRRTRLQARTSGAMQYRGRGRWERP